MRSRSTRATSASRSARTRSAAWRRRCGSSRRTAARRSRSASALQRQSSSCARRWRSASTARSISSPTSVEWDPQAVAGAIVDAIRADEAEHGPFDLIFFGNEAADSGNYQVGIRVAHALGRPVATGLKGVTVEGGEVRCEREEGAGREVYRLTLPAVVTVKEGLNFPRFPSVPAKLRAQKKPVAISEPTRPEPRLQKLRLVHPEGEAKQAEILGEGAAAAPRVVEVLQELGLAR